MGNAATALPVHRAKLPSMTFETFFDAEHERLFRALYVLTGSTVEAEEIMQDTFVAVWERWDRVAGMEEPTGYLFKTALNRFRSRIRRAARAARWATNAPDVRDEFALVDERDALARALALLPARQRAAIVLTELLGYNPEGAAYVLGVKESTVRSLSSRGRQALRQRLELDDE